MRKFGFKMFSTNMQNAPEYVNECIEFAKTNPDTFIEIMTVPSTSIDEYINLKKQLGDVEVRIHAPYMGVDTGNKEFESQNRRILAVSQKAADILKAKTIIVHAGYNHGEKYIAETARQFKLFNDSRVVVENLPYFDTDGEKLHANTAAEIKYIMEESGCGFCFDFSHAICAALSLNISVEEQLKSFFALNPSVYHICDGYINKPEDLHMHLRCGNYPLEHFLNDFTAEDAYITMETGAGLELHANLKIEDYKYLKSVQN